ncbi:MAG TPA: cupin fold metalloprotein, WbuC family [Gammaproteobacteria bacterium]|nr:cupin fold metalloprotein, WbuC family [Gammaproteobacteria bacterium]
MALGPIAAIGCDEIEFLRREVYRNEKGRVRINLHSENADPLHEMFIAMRPDSYIRPHKHLNKSEAFHIIYGEADIIIFEDDGRIREVVHLASGSSIKAFYYRMSKSFFHTLVIRSDVLVVHEITNGPFINDATIFGDFAPDASSGFNVISAWQNELADRVRQMP